MHWKRAHQIIRLILILIPVVTLGWLTGKDFAFSGVLEATYDFSRDSPFIDHLWPPGRALELTQDEKGTYYQPIVHEPVYFYLKMPRSTFQKATFEIKYQKPKDLSLELGPQIRPDFWQYGVEELRENGQIDGWQVARASFDLSKIQMANNRIHFAISIPGIDEAQEAVRISEIKVTLEKEPITLENFFPRLMNYLKKKIYEL